MALAVASNSTTTGSGTSVVATKPTGLTEGDLLFAFVIREDDNDGIDGTITAPAGFTSEEDIIYDQGSLNVSRATFWKVASSSDEAASNFTFSWTGSVDYAEVIMLRITSSGTLPADPLITIVTNTATGATTTPSHSVSFPYYTENALLLASVITVDNWSSVSGYTASGTNPTWTEVRDNDTPDASWFVIHGDPSTPDEITSFTYTQASSTSFQRRLILIALAEEENASANIDRLEVTPSFRGLTGANTSRADIDHLEAEPSLNGLSAVSSSDGTQWTNETKPSTTWTNEQK